jgi:hypothetical protein
VALPPKGSATESQHHDLRERTVSGNQARKESSTRTGAKEERLGSHEVNLFSDEADLEKGVIETRATRRAAQHLAPCLSSSGRKSSRDEAKQKKKLASGRRSLEHCACHFRNSNNFSQLRSPQPGLEPPSPASTVSVPPRVCTVCIVGIILSRAELRWKPTLIGCRTRGVRRRSRSLGLADAATFPRVCWLIEESR